MPKSTTPSAPDAYTWQTLVEFILLSGVEDEHLAMAQVANVASALGAPPAWLAWLQTTIRAAVARATTVQPFPLTQPICIRVCACPPVVQTSAATAADRDDTTGELTVAQPAKQAADAWLGRSWGFFRVEKWVKRELTVPTQPQLVIEIYIYQEQ